MSKIFSINVIKYSMNVLVAVIVLFGAYQIAEKSYRLFFEPKEINNLKIDVPWNQPMIPVVVMFDQNKLINDPAMHKQISKNLYTFDLIKRTITIILLLLIIIQLKKLLIAIKGKTFLESKNILIIKTLSILVGIWVVLNFILYLLLPVFIPENFVVESVNFVSLNESTLSALMIGIDFKMLFAAIILYVVSVLFKEGYQLKEESNLTI